MTGARDDVVIILAVKIGEQETKLGGKARKRAERHDVQDGHPPGVLVFENIELLLDIRFNRHRFEPYISPNCNGNNDRHIDQRGVLVPNNDVAASGEFHGLGSQKPKHSKANKPGSKKLDERYAKVSDPGLDAQRGALQAFGKEIGRGGHETRERATADAG